METSTAKPAHNFPMSSSSLLIIPNGCINKELKKNSDDSSVSDAADYQVFDIEMISIASSSSYTSLKDLLTAVSPATSRKNSCKEIPIKHPLLQHAAWAYLQPMAGATPLESSHHPSFLRKLFDKFCGGFFGCLTLWFWWC